MRRTILALLVAFSMTAASPAAAAEGPWAWLVRSASGALTRNAVSGSTRMDWRLTEAWDSIPMASLGETEARGSIRMASPRVASAVSSSTRTADTGLPFRRPRQDSLASTFRSRGLT